MGPLCLKEGSFLTTLPLLPVTSPPFPLYLGKMGHLQGLLYLESDSTVPSYDRNPSQAITNTNDYSTLCNVGDLPKVGFNAYLPHSRFYTSVNVTRVPMNLFCNHLLETILEPFLQAGACPLSTSCCSG